MKHFVRYFLILLSILLVTAIIIGLFYIRYAYQTLIVDNEASFPPFIVRVINKLSHTTPAPKIIPKSEDTIQILEGWTNRDIGQYFEHLGKWQSEEFLEVAGFPQVDYRGNKEMPSLKDLSGEFSFLTDKPKYYGLEGYLFPDTYRIYASSTVAEVIDKMLTNFDAK